MPFRFGHFVQFWELLSFSHNCYTSKSQLKNHLAQKSVSRFQCIGFNTNLLFFTLPTSRLHMSPGVSRWDMTKVPSAITTKNQKTTVWSPPSSLVLAGLPPFYLLLSPVKTSKLCKTKKLQHLQLYLQYFPVPVWRTVFFTYAKSETVFCMLQWTFAFCLAPYSIKVSPSFSSPRLLLLISDSISALVCLCVNVLCFLFLCLQTVYAA